MSRLAEAIITKRARADCALQGAQTGGVAFSLRSSDLRGNWSGSTGTLTTWCHWFCAQHQCDRQNLHWTGARKKTFAAIDDVFNLENCVLWTLDNKNVYSGRVIKINIFGDPPGLRNTGRRLGLTRISLITHGYYQPLRKTRLQKNSSYSASVLAQVIFDGLLRYHTDHNARRQPAMAMSTHLSDRSMDFRRGQNRRQKRLAALRGFSSA